MTLIDAVNNLYATYGKYGFEKSQLGLLICDGMENYGLSLEACYNGMRMILGEQCHEQEIFSTDEVAEMMGISKEEAIQEIEKYKAGMEARGEDTSKSIMPAQQSIKFLYMPKKKR